MLEHLDSYLVAQQAPLKAALIELVRIPSVCDEGAASSRGYPFGALTHAELLTEHQPNERTILANLFKALEIYAHAIYQLTR